MTTTQPTEFTNGSRSLTITESCVIVTDEKGWIHTYPFDTPEQAHRAALAILTGPGKVDPDGTVTDQDLAEAAACHLRAHVRRLDAEAAAEAEVAELRAEALAILKAMNPENPMETWEEWGAWGQAHGLKAARVAREARRLHTNKETQHG